MTDYPNVQLHIGGAWGPASDGRTLDVTNPATGLVIGKAAHAAPADVDRAAEAAWRAFAAWREVPPFERAKPMHQAADLLRSRAASIAALMTQEQGKPVADAVGEVESSADILDWFAEEGKRLYGRLVPARVPGVNQAIVREPVGPVAAFSPWNFPVLQAVRKLAAALATGCTAVLKGPEETPASCAELIRALVDAGLPPGVVNLVYGSPADISARLIADPRIRKISFTGSTQVGKQLASLAGLHMKRATMELGGHAPAIVFEDADLDAAIQTLARNKFRNAGQICVAPSRFLVETSIYDRFVDGFCAVARDLRVGEGTDPAAQMGPLANPRRLAAMERLVADAAGKGATVRTGGHRTGNRGYFFAPTVLTEVSTDMAIMNDEPFGPVAPIIPFHGIEAALAEGNRLPYGLAAYVWTGSPRTANRMGAALENGIISVNQHARSTPEVVFGGFKDSGYGSEGGPEALEAYVNVKLISQAGFL